MKFVALQILMLGLLVAIGSAAPPSGVEPSGAYYDWTKTKLPEKPYFHQYDQTLVYKMLLAEKMNGGKDCKVDLTFAQTLDVIKRIDVITCGAPKIVYLAGWQYNGHDSKYPALGEVNERLKRPEDKTALDSLKWLIAEGKNYHTIVSLHICMIEANEDSPLWKTYLEKDIIAKDKQDKPLKGEVYGNIDVYKLPLAERDALSPRAVAMGAQQSYNISYAREWETGETQKLIDGLMAMLPELKEGHTIHIDAFHTYPPIPFAYPAGQYTSYDRKFNGISPYLGYTADKEAAAQRKILRYFRDKHQMDVTCEGSTFLRFDPFVGLQPMAYHYGGPGVPPKLYCGTPFEHAETVILKDPQKLPGMLDMFCLSGAPVIWSNHWRHDDDSKQPQAADWHRVQQGGDICIPLIWKKEKTLLAYSRGGYARKTWTLPDEWKSVRTAALTRIASDGTKTEDAGTVEIKDGRLTLSLKAGELFLLLPAFVASAAPAPLHPAPAANTQPVAAPSGAASIVVAGNLWTLANGTIKARLAFRNGSFAMTDLVNVAAKRDYLTGRSPIPLFSYTVQGVPCAASDGKWLLAGSSVSPIVLFGKIWGKRLEVTLRRTAPADFSVREVFEIYDGGALRCFSYLKNGTDKPLTISDSDTLSLNLPNDPHDIAYITGKFMWNVGKAGAGRQYRTVITRYDTGDGWYILPEDNWATSLNPGGYQGDYNHKFIYAYAWDKEERVRVSSNPKAVQLILFPHEEIEWFSADLGVFKGDFVDARAASAAHLRRRFKYIDTSFVVSYNDWYWYNSGHGRVDKDYREIVIPTLQAAGFDNLLLDGEWNATNDVVAPRGNWTDMAALSQFASEHGLGLGTWFCLHGSTIWGGGRDCADPATVDLKLKQVEDDLIGKYHVMWDQVDLGLCWKTDKETSYSHPGDSVYRKILGMKRFENTIADKYPGFMMQTTGEVDNVGNGPGEGICPNRGSTGLIHIPDNGTSGAADDAGDDVDGAFENFGLLPLESRVSCMGDPNPMSTPMQDSPMFFYQFLLNRHSMLYTQPGVWSPQIIKHMRTFNDWRKNPRIKAILSQGMLPVYNGPDWIKNQGPWCWMFTDDAKSQAIVIAINHRNLNKNNAFSAKLRWLDEKKIYLVEEITQLPDGSSNYNYRGEFSGADLKADGLPVNLDLGKEKCVAFFIQEKKGEQPQVLYADSAVTKYISQSHGEKLALQVEGAPNATAKVIVCNPVRNRAEIHAVSLNASGRAAAVFSP